MKWKEERDGMEIERKGEMVSDGIGQIEIGREEEDCFYRKGKGVGRRMGRARFMLVSSSVHYYERRCYVMLGTVCTSY